MDSINITTPEDIVREVTTASDETVTQDAVEETVASDPFAEAEAKIAALEAKVTEAETEVGRLQTRIMQERNEASEALRRFKVEVGRRAIEEKDNLGYCDQLFSVLDELGIDLDDLKTKMTVTATFDVLAFAAGSHSETWWGQSFNYDWEYDDPDENGYLRITMDSDVKQARFDNFNIVSVVLDE